jgi:uncharacterized protein YxjI
MFQRRANRQPAIQNVPSNDPLQQGASAGDSKQATTEQRIGTRFTMKQRIFAIGDDFYITSEQGEKIIKVDGKAFRLRDTLRFEDMQGRELYHITGRIVDIRDTMDIKRPDGQRAAVVHNALITPVRDRWQIDIPNGEELIAIGNIVQHEYIIRPKRSDMPLAIVSKRWLRIRDTYSVEIQNSADVALILAITVVIDMMAHD